jgi:Ras family protein A
MISQWYPEVLHFCPYTPLVLVGLKSDLRTKRTCIDLLKTQGLTPVTTEQGQAVAEKMGARYMECSSKEMTGVDEIFESAINIVVANDPSNQRKQSKRESRYVPTSSGQSMGETGGGMRRKRRKCNFL